MLQQTITHYFPVDGSDHVAYCGHLMGTQDVHATLPTCAACAAQLDTEDAAFAELPLPLDADEARDLDPLLNAGLDPTVTPTITPAPFAEDLFALAVTLTRVYAAAVLPKVPRLAGRRGRRRYCELCDEWMTPQTCKACGASTVKGAAA